MDCNFSLLSVHFAVDPAANSEPSKLSYDRQMSLSEQVYLMAEFMDVDLVPTHNTQPPSSSSSQLLDPAGEMRPRTASWGGRDTETQEDTQTQRQTGTERQTDTGTQRKMERRAADTDTVAERKIDKKKMKAETMSSKLGQLGRAVSRKLRPGAERRPERQRAVNDDRELRQRRKMSIGSATQSTRLSCLTDDMLSDHSQV